MGTVKDGGPQGFRARDNWIHRILPEHITLSSRSVEIIMTREHMTQFQPILLGSDMNVYGMARAFHEAYGVTSRAIAHSQLSPTKFSRIVHVDVIPHFDQPDTFVRTLLGIAATSRTEHPGTSLLLIPCGDLYVNLLSAARERLAPHFLFNALDENLNRRLSYKSSFYQICERHGLPHPKTVVVNAEEVARGNHLRLPFGFPMVMKPADSAAWLTIDFPGRKKAFIITTADELDTLIRRAYAAGYAGEMILQDFVPGDDNRMRVLNAYVDQHHRVRMMFLGHPILEDPAPGAVGNYAAILPTYDKTICTRIKAFLEDIEYCGVANFDMKYDERDGGYKLFEINLRQGRSSYVVTLNGHNLATYFVHDLVEDTAFSGSTLFATGSKLWLGAPPSIVDDYVAEGPDKREAQAMIARGDWGSTLDYRADMNLLRRLMLRRVNSAYRRHYERYFQSKEELR